MCTSPRYITKFTKEGERRVYRCRCGKCQSCLRDDRRDWCFRMEQEYKRTNVGVFLTLTYADWALPLTDTGVPTLDYTDVQLFLKRLREHYSRTCPKSEQNPITFWCCGEYGKKTGRPHYHLLFFGFQPEYNYLIDKCWLYGFTYKGYKMSGKCINYVSKYVQKQGSIKMLRNVKGSDEWCDKRGVVRPFRHMSLGLGSNYLTESVVMYHLGLHSNFSRIGVPIHVNGRFMLSSPRLSVIGFNNPTGKAINYPLPRYYRKKIFSENIYNTYDYGISQSIAFATYFYRYFTLLPFAVSSGYDESFADKYSFSSLTADTLGIYGCDLRSLDESNLEVFKMREKRIASDLCRSMLTPDDWCDLSQDELYSNSNLVPINF